jgi:hypothetical protein
MPRIYQTLSKDNLSPGFIQQQYIRLPNPVFEQNKYDNEQGNRPYENSAGNFHGSLLLWNKFGVKV